MIVGRRGTFAILAGAGALALLPRGASAQGLTVEAVLNDPDAPVLGNPQGGLTIVEYFDYQCPFCKAMHRPLTEVVAEDGDIRLVLKDWPIFGAASLRASQLALGAVDLGAYEAVVSALMATKGRLSDRQVDRAVSAVVAPAEARKSYRRRRARWDGLMSRNAFQATALGFQGTPGVAVETTIYDGAMDAQALRDAIAEARDQA